MQEAILEHKSELRFLFLNHFSNLFCLLENVKITQKDNHKIYNFK